MSLKQERQRHSHPGLAEALEQAAKEAKAQYSHVMAIVEATRAGMHKLQKSLKANKVEISGTHAEVIRKAFADFEKRLATIRSDFESLVAQKVEERQKHLDVFTIMLFGRTMAGKSTLMEALTEGEGKSIGIGLQNTTVNITEYRWNGLRVVDTPGIQGLANGNELEVLAKEFVDQADAIIFVCSDDVIMPADFDAMQFVRDQNKPTWVVLNVKHADINDLLDDPSSVFRAEELDGHTRRINGKMREQMGLPHVEVLPVHAKAAWFASRPEKAANDVMNRLARPGEINKLREASRFPVLEGFLIERISATAIQLRAKAAHESVTYHLASMQQNLILANRDLRRLCETVNDWKRTYQKRCDRTWATGIEILKELKATVGVMRSDAYGAAESAVDGHLDANQWLKDKNADLAAIANHLQELICSKVKDLNSEFISQINEELGALSVAIQVESAEIGSGTGGPSINRGNVTKIVGSVISGALGVIGSIMVLSNPIGWAVIGAAGLAKLLSSWFGDWVSRKDANAHKREVDTLVRQLRENLWKNYECLQETSYQWLKNHLDAHRSNGEELLSSQYRMLIKSRELTRETAALLAEQADTASLHILRLVLGARVGVIRNQTLLVSAVARKPGKLCKVILDGPENMVGLVIGPGGSVIRRVSDDLGGELIHICVRSDDQEIMLRRLLRIDRDAAWICRSSPGRWTVSRTAGGMPRFTPGSLDLELASRLCKVDIHLERPRS